MRAVLLFGLVLVSSAAALVDVQRGYHAEIGIPLAEKIRAHEEGQQVAELTDVENKIVGGALAPVGAYPFFAGLLISLVNVAGNSVCGSSLLTSNRLVTAAHCWRDSQNQAWQFVVILGSNSLFTGGTRIATSNVITHPQYTISNLNNDIAMIYLPTSVGFTNDIRPIELPTASEVWEQFVGRWAMAAGFGRTSDQQAGASTIVHHVNLQVIGVPQCQATFGTNFVQPSTICTNGVGGVGICGGDSGGPLAINHNGRLILIGVSSFVARDGCQLGHPSAFARVTSFRDFIIQHL